MKIKKFLRTFILIVILAALGLFVEIDYYVIRPSRAVDLKELITVEELENGVQDIRGTFSLVTVTQQRATPFSALYGYIHPHMELRPKSVVLPGDMDREEYRELLREYMVESRHIAQVVALRRVGYEVEIASEGVEVVSFLEEAPAETYLEIGDKITSVDGREVFLATEVPLLVQDRAVGEGVRLNITRSEQNLEIEVPTGPHFEDEDTPFLGIYIKTLPWEPALPVDIVMDTGQISGPSAGLMFVLEIKNRFTPEDLSAGKTIAGTGTIDLDEKVGRVGGIPQKVIASEKAGAEYFLVPEGNYEGAVAAAGEIEVIPVADLDNALEFLSTLIGR